jgi:hypothetical protein
MTHTLNLLGGNSTGCGCCVSRRRFLSTCATCAALGDLALSSPRSWAAAEGKRPKVRVVFCQPKNDRPTWPNIGYDYPAREKQILDSLTKGCPQIDFVPARMIDQSAKDSGLLAKDNEVDGYIVCLLGLGWEYKYQDLCTTGKPTLLVDNLFGGSGLFLQVGQVVKTGKPVDWISSSSPDDLVAAARQFSLLNEGRSAKEVAAKFRAVRHERTPSLSKMKCEPDAVQTIAFDDAFKKLKKTKVLVVGGGWGGDEFRKAAQQVTGVTFIPIEFQELAAAYEVADQNAARIFAEQWTQKAQRVVEPSADDIQKSGQMHAAMVDVMKKHQATGISINCLGGFYGGHLKAYPCLGFCQFNNDGLVGGCEADQMSALTMTVMGALTQRPGYISDPVIDTSRNEIIYAHCVAITKPFGPQGATNPYRIRSHSEDRHGAAIQSLLPENYLVSTLEINPVSREVLFHQARSAGNNPSDMACRTKLAAELHGDIEKLTENWRMGWHRVTFYGDLKEPVQELCDRWKLKLIEEA